MEDNATAGPETHRAHSGCFVCGTAVPLLKNLWSDATKDHFRSSRIEFLKGIRSLIDDRISHLSRADTKGTHVTVE